MISAARQEIRDVIDEIPECNLDALRSLLCLLAFRRGEGAL